MGGKTVGSKLPGPAGWEENSGSFRITARLWRHRFRAVDLDLERRHERTNQVMTVEAVVTAADDQRKLLRVDGFLLVDGRVIYAMKNFTVCQTRSG